MVNISKRSRGKLENLLSLDTKRLGDHKLVVELKPILLPPQRLFSGRTYFSVYFEDEYGRIAQNPVVDRALYSVGGKGALPWIEIGYYRPEAIFAEEGNLLRSVNIADTDTELKLFKLLGDFIPPGGHMMIPYDLDDNVLSRMTFAALEKKIPMVATPIGFLLFRIGFTIPFKDWYISEGGHEGPRKLQFEKPSTDQRAREVSERIVDELADFTDRFGDTKDGEVVKYCLNNAYRIRDMIISFSQSSESPRGFQPNS
jgi:hypothetical protein